MSIVIAKRQTKAHRRMPAAVPDFPVARMTVPEYLSLIENGFFGNRRIELWEGWVIDRMPHGTVSAMIIAVLTRWFGAKLSDQVSVRPQLPIRLKKSCPEPDVAIADGPDSAFENRHPNAKETMLVIEVSDSSLHDDRMIKGRIYADASIPEYWIVNCVDQQVEIRTDPSSTGKLPQYRKLTTYLPGQKIPVHIAGRKLGELSVNAFFGLSK